VPMKAANKAERLLKWAKITAEWTVPPSAEDILRMDEERLLSDPVWSDAVSEDETAFAARLLELHDPTTIAAAYLRLFRSHHSAPEELSAPDAAPPARERKPFGPSRWVALSVGADDRAEARWLLPLLCRAGKLDKTAIGAIRVQASETFVELTEASITGFLAALGDGAELDEGITVRALDAAPDVGPPPRKPRPDAPRGNPAPRGDKPHRAPRETTSRRSPEEAAEREAYVRDSVKPYAKPRRDGDAPKGKLRARPADGPKGHTGKPGKPGGDGPKPRGDKPWSDKPRPDKPRPDKPRSDKPRGPKPDARKPDAKPRDAGKPATRPSAADPSKRFERPGGKSKGKPGGKPAHKGHSQPPRRPKG